MSSIGLRKALTVAAYVGSCLGLLVFRIVPLQHARRLVLDMHRQTAVIPTESTVSSVKTTCPQADALTLFRRGCKLENDTGTFNGTQ